MKSALLGSNRPLRTQAKAAYYTAIPHSQNSAVRKTATIVLVLTWAVITILVTTGDAVPTEAYAVLTAWVWRRWGMIEEQEAQRLADSEDSK